MLDCGACGDPADVMRGFVESSVRPLALALLAALVLLATLTAGARGAASLYAPVNRPGPRLSVPRRDLAAEPPLRCYVFAHGCRSRRR